MSSKNVCKYEKYGHCKLKKECKDYHPTEVCKEPVCKVAKCSKRHPQPCRYYKAGSCRFNEYCKYDHQEQLNTKELLVKIKNLEEEKNKILQMYESLSKRIFTLEENQKNKNRREEETIVDEAMNVDQETLVCDDHTKSFKESRKRKLPSCDNEEASSQENVTTTKTKTIKKENEVYEDTLKGLKNIRLKLKTTKKEDFTKILKNFVERKMKEPENFSSHNTKSMIDYIEDTNRTFITYDAKMFKTNAEKDLNKLISDIEKAMNMLKMEKN